MATGSPLHEPFVSEQHYLNLESLELQAPYTDTKYIRLFNSLYIPGRLKIFSLYFSTQHSFMHYWLYHEDLAALEEFATRLSGVKNVNIHLKKNQDARVCHRVRETGNWILSDGRPRVLQENLKKKKLSRNTESLLIIVPSGIESLLELKKPLVPLRHPIERKNLVFSVYKMTRR